MTSESPLISCQTFAHQLEGVLEGEVDGATRAALQAHAGRCAQCGALLAGLRRVSTEAARLPALTPSRDLWPGIAARLQTPVVPFVARRRVHWSPRILTVGLAAALVLAAALGYEVAHRGAARPGTLAPATTSPAVAQRSVPDARPPAAAARTPAPSPTASRRAVLAADRVADATPAAVEKSYDVEIAGLRAVLAARRSHLDTATVAVIEKNLAVIDSAIAQCRTALSKDPASRYLMQSFSQSLDTKVQLLRIAAGLPAST
jgi:hypothetical protein